MRREKKIYAKEQQIKIIDNILCSLCKLELTDDGRKYLNRMKERINKDLEYLKLQESELSQREKFSALSYLRFKLFDSLRAPW